MLNWLQNEASALNGTSMARARSKGLRLEASLLYHFAVISNRVGGRIHALCRERYGMSPSAWRVMAHLGELQPVSAKEIGLRAAMDSVNLTRALNQLDDLGFVERSIDPSDRRRVILSLTPAGLDVYGAVAPVTLAAEKELLAALDKREQEALRALARRLWEHSNALQAERSEPIGFDSGK